MNDAGGRHNVDRARLELIFLLSGVGCRPQEGLKSSERWEVDYYDDGDEGEMSIEFTGPNTVARLCNDILFSISD